MIGEPHKSPSIPPKVLWPVLIVVILGIAVGGFFLLNNYIYHEKQGDDANTALVADQVNENVNLDTNHDTTDWKVYTNEEYGFTFNYPNDWTLTSKEDGDVRTLSVNPITYQEPYPLIQVYQGSYSEALDWMNAQPGVNAAFTETDDSRTVSGVSSKVVSNYVYTHYALVDAGSFTLIILLPEDVNGEQLQYNSIIDSIVISMESWQTYTNDKWGFQIKYPGIYKLQDNQRSSDLFLVFFEYPNDGLTWGCSVTVFDTSITDFVESVTPYGVTDEGDVTINGLSWRKLSYDPKDDPSATDQSKGVSYLIEKNGNTYKLSCNTDVTTTETSAETLNANVDAMIQSFMFSHDTPDWQTYHDEPHGFSVKYPPAWTVEVSNEAGRDNNLYGLFFDTHKTPYSYLPSIIVRSNWSADQEITAVNESDPPFSNVESTEDTVVGALPAKRIVSHSAIGLMFEEVVLVVDGNAYIFTSVEGDSDFQGVVSTFSIN